MLLWPWYLVLRHRNAGTDQLMQPDLSCTFPHTSSPLRMTNHIRYFASNKEHS